MAAAEDMIDIAVKVPKDRLAAFYVNHGQWLDGTSDLASGLEEGPAEPQIVDWSDTPEDETLAKLVWSKLSPRAKALFGTLLDHPEQRFTGLQLAEMHNIPKGMYGIAGVLAWPARHSAAVNRSLPWEFEYGPAGASASYWMSSEVAALFRKVRDAT